MRIEILADAEAVATRAAAFIARNAREAFRQTGKFVMAVSGGRTPWLMLRNLAKEDIPWGALHVFQVDERIAPADDPERNLKHLREVLPERFPQNAATIYPMPVEESNLIVATELYSRQLAAVSGCPRVLDLVHLGLGEDGHTASLVPGDPALKVINHDVVVTEPYRNRRRMTLTYPILNRARQILWVVTGSEKQRALDLLLNRDVSIPGGLINQEHALVLADEAAAGAHCANVT